MEEKNQTQFKYHAFISYRHADNKEQGRQWATWLHQAIETYEVPKDLVGKKSGRGDLIPERIYPIFRDEEELPAHADLGTSIVSALEQTNLLVVLCSPRAVASTYVADEIDYFKKLGGSERIIAAMIDGEPNTSWDESKLSLGFSKEDECFPLPLQFEYDQNGNPTKKHAEPIAADFRINNDGKPEQGFTTPAAYSEHLKKSTELNNKEIAQKLENYQQQLHLMLLKIIAGILGVPLGELTQRDKEYQLEQARLKARSLRNWLAVLAVFTLASVAAGIFAYLQKEKAVEQRIAAQTTESRFLAKASMDKLKGEGTQGAALQIVLHGLPKPEDMQARPVVPKAMFALTSALLNNRTAQEIKWENNTFDSVVESADNNHLLFKDGSSLRRFKMEDGRWREQSSVALTANEGRRIHALPEQDSLLVACTKECNFVLRKISSPEIGTEIKLMHEPDSDAIFAKPCLSSALQYVLHSNGMLESFDLKTAKSVAINPVYESLGMNFSMDHAKNLYVNGELKLLVLVEESRVLVIDILTGKARYEFDRDEAITATSMVSSTLAIGFADGYLQVINFATSEYVFRNNILDGAISDIAFDLGSEQLLVSSNTGGGLAYMDLRSDPEPKMLVGLNEDISQVAFSPDGSLLMGLDVMGKIRVWQFQSYNGTKELMPIIDFDLPDKSATDGFTKRLKQGRVIGRNARFGSDNASLIVADNMSMLRFVRIEAPIGSNIHSELPGGQELFSSSKAETIVALDRVNKTISILDSTNLSVLKVIDDLPAAPELVILSDKADAIFVVMSSIGVIERRSTETGELLATLSGTSDTENEQRNPLIGESIFGYDIREDGSKLAVSTIEGNLFIWDLTQNTLDATNHVIRRNRGLSTLSWSPSGEHLLVSSLRKKPVIVHMESFLKVLDPSQFDALKMDDTLQDEKLKEKQKALNKSRLELSKLAVRPLVDIVQQEFRSAVYLDDNTVLGVSERGDLVTVNLNGEVLFSQKKAQENIGTMLTLDRTNSLLYSASGLRERTLWSVKDPRNPKRIWQGLSSNLRPFISADGKIFAMLPNPTNIFLLNTETGDLISAYGGHKLSVTGVAFSKNANTVISSSLNNTLTWGNLNNTPQDWIEQAESNLNRFSPLTRIEGCLNLLLPEADCP